MYFPVSKEAICKGLQKVSYPGRLQWIRNDILVDCAHNEAGAKQLGSFLMGLSRTKNRILILGVSRDKDLRNIIMPIVNQVDKVYVFAADHPRAVPTLELQSQLESLRVEADILPSLDIVPSILAADNMLVVTGSIFLVGRFCDWYYANVAAD